MSVDVFAMPVSVVNAADTSESSIVAAAALVVAVGLRVRPIVCIVVATSAGKRVVRFAYASTHGMLPLGSVDIGVMCVFEVLPSVAHTSSAIDNASDEIRPARMS